MNLQPNHLSHEQLCDVLLSSDADATSAVLMARNETSQEHLRNCLICASELDLMRSSVAGFHDASTALADRELARRPIRPRFAPIYGAASSAASSRFAFVWATAALVIAAVIPLGLLNPRFNPMVEPNTISTQPAVSTDSSSQSDAALLDDIDQDLSAAVPTPMQPLAGPSAETSAEPASTDTQDQN